MKILLLTPDIPFPSESGGALRNYGIVRGLWAAGHHLTLLTFVEKPVDPASNPLFQLCDAVHTVSLPQHSKLKRIIRLLNSKMADLEFRLRCAEFEEALKAILQRDAFDIIQFSGIELGCYLPQIQAGKKHAKLVFDALNAEADLQRVIAQVDAKQPRRWHASIYSTVQARRLSRFEGEICRGVDAVIAVSEEDQGLLRNYGGAPIFVMSNGIQVDDYRPPVDNSRQSYQLVFSGKMDYRPNVDAIEWFHQAILPGVLKRYPQARLVIVGRNPNPRIKALAAEAQISITGWVEAVQPYLHSASIYIVPLRMGSGTRLKILQAMAAGCAVISTSIGAAGLNRGTRETLEIADEAESFTRAIVSLLDNKARQDELGALARQAVSESYDWAVLIPQLLNAYKELGLG